MNNIDFARIFGNITQSFSDRIHSTHAPRTSAVAKKCRNRRTCRIEELESREMLSVNVLDFDLSEPAAVPPYVEVSGDAVAGSFANAPILAAAAPFNAHARDLAVYNDLIARGCLDGNFTWNSDGQITRIWVIYGGLTGKLDVSGLTALTRLDCYNNQLTELDTSGCTALTTLDCAVNQLTKLDVSNNTALTYLSCYLNQLPELDVSGLTALTMLNCYNNQLTELDVLGLSALTTLNCHNNQLTELDVLGLTALTTLNCYNNQLTELDVLGLTALTTLDCGGNQLTKLDVSNNTALTYLSCYLNQLTELDVSNNTALTLLSCHLNQLTELNVSNNTALTSLYCGDTQLTELDVSNNTALTSLYCGDTQLTELDVSNNTALTTLECGDTQLTELNVSNNTALTTLSCYNNQLTVLNLVGTPLAADFETAFRIDKGSYCTYSYNTSPSRSLTVDKTVTLKSMSTPEIINVLTLSGGEIIVTWSTVLNAGSYVFEYSTADTFADAQTTPLTSTWISLGVLDAGAYYFRVMAVGINNYSESDWSEVESVNIVLPQLASPVLNSVTAAGSSSINVSWNSVQNAQWGYTVQYATNAAFTQNLLTKEVNGTSTTLENLAANQTYYVRVVAAGNDTDYRDSGASNVLSAMTEKITLAAPAIDKVIHVEDGEVIVTWETVPNAAGYVVEYATNSTFTGALTVSIVGNASTWASLGTLEANETYYFRVMATGSGMYADSGWSSTVSELTQATRLLPPGNVQAGGLSKSMLHVTWDSVPMAAGYMIEYATDADFTQNKGSQSVTDGTDCVLTSLEEGQEYFVQVKAVGSGEYADSLAAAANQKESVATLTQAEAAATVNVSAAVKPKVKKTTKGLPVGSVTLSWNAKNAQAAAYEISLNGKVITTVVGTSTTISGLNPGMKYTFTVTALNANDASVNSKGKSTVTKVSVKLPKYNAVKSLKAVKKATTFDSVTLTWKASTGGVDERYHIVVLDAKGNALSAEALSELGIGEVTDTLPDKKGNTLKTVTISGLSASTKYRVLVTAFTGEMFDSAIYQAAKAARVSVSTLR